MIFGTEVHWTNTINLSRGPTKKVYIWRCYDVIFQEIQEISKNLQNCARHMHMGINRKLTTLLDEIYNFPALKVKILATRKHFPGNDVIFNKLRK